MALARLAFATGGPDAAVDHQRRLNDLNADLGRIEDVLDRIGYYLGPGEDSRAYQRARRLARELGQSRIAAVRRHLIAEGIENVDGRLHVPAVLFADKDDPARAGSVRAALVRLRTR
jgi:hypothetical protein